MIQRSLWKRPALQTSEAVLLPAHAPNEGGGAGLFRRVSSRPPYRRPLPPGRNEETPRTALSTYVRPRGSMAGRSVLRAVGIGADPYLRRKTESRMAGPADGALFPMVKPKRDRNNACLFSYGHMVEF